MTRGFSLVEVLVSLALGGLLVGGAFELNLAFNRQSARQQKVAEMHQTLRVSRQVIERALRNAGLGLQSGSLQMPGGALGCGQLYPVQFFNRNAYPPVVDSIANDVDLDPDWLMLVSSADTSEGLGCPLGSCGGNLGGALQPVRVAMTEDFTTLAAGGGNLVVVVDGTVPEPAPPLPVPRINCVLAITGINPAAGPGQLTYAAPGCPGGPCNPVALPFPAPVRKLNGTGSAVPAVTLLRVQRAGDPAIANCPAPPCLMASFAGIGEPPRWQMVAEFIEDLQIAILLNDGRVCGTRDPGSGALYSVDDPAICDPRAARAVRFSLTVRSSSTVPGFGLGTFGGIEDEPASDGAPLGLAPDAFLRRTVTAEVQWRNSL